MLSIIKYAFIISLFVFSAESFALSKLGHQLVCELAYQQLPEAKKQALEDKKKKILEDYMSQRSDDAGTEEEIKYFTEENKRKKINELRRAMEKAAKDLNFIEAARLRDMLKKFNN